jgi:hypothetical protein
MTIPEIIDPQAIRTMYIASSVRSILEVFFVIRNDTANAAMLKKEFLVP